MDESVPTSQSANGQSQSDPSSIEVSPLALKADALTGELQARNAELEAENRRLVFMIAYRSRFLARLVHELRTPLTSILGFAEILISQEQLTGVQTDFCRKIQKSALQLQANFTQLADLSRLETGQTELFLEEFDIARAITESTAAVARQAQKQNVSVNYMADRSLPLIVSDRSKLRQVLYNFLAYAVFRTPEEGRVNVSTRANLEQTIVIIEDEGELLPDPAHSLSRGELSPEVQLGGGNELGIAIARQLINVLGAKLSFQNLELKGLQIMIHLPTRPRGTA